MLRAPSPDELYEGTVTPVLSCCECGWPLIEDGKLKCNRSKHTVRATLGKKQIYCPRCWGPRVILAINGQAACPKCGTLTNFTISDKEILMATDTVRRRKTSKTRMLQGFVEHLFQNGNEGEKALAAYVKGIDFDPDRMENILQTQLKLGRGFPYMPQEIGRFLLHWRSKVIPSLVLVLEIKPFYEHTGGNLDLRLYKKLDEGTGRERSITMVGLSAQILGIEYGDNTVIFRLGPEPEGERSRINCAALYVRRTGVDVSPWSEPIIKGPRFSLSFMREELELDFELEELEKGT